MRPSVVCGLTQREMRWTQRERTLAELLLDRALSHSTRGVGSLHGSCYVLLIVFSFSFDLSLRAENEDCTNNCVLGVGL